MRTLITLFVLCMSGFVLAQNPKAPSLTKYTERELVNKVIEDDVDAFRVKNINPENAWVFTKDSLSRQDTAVKDFANKFYEQYITINNRHATLADTVASEQFSLTKNNWTQYAIGLRDTFTDDLELNNTLIIIPANTSRTFKVNIKRVGKMRVRTLSNRNRVMDVGFTGVN